MVQEQIKRIVPRNSSAGRDYFEPNRKDVRSTMKKILKVLSNDNNMAEPEKGHRLINEGRKDFFSYLYAFLVTALGLIIVWPVLRFVTYVVPQVEEVTFPETLQMQGVFFKKGVFIVRTGDRLLAISSKCTHLGCTVLYDLEKKQFHCPCHGSVFDIHGRRISGPARKPLERLNYKSKKDGSIVVRKPL